MCDMRVIVIGAILLSSFFCLPVDSPKAGGIEITAPAEGEVVQGKISIQATVRSPVKRGAVDFYFQEHGAKDRYGWVDFEPPFGWGGDTRRLDTTMFADGPSSVVAYYINERTGNLIAESRVSFVIDNGKPQLIVIAPKHDQTVEDSIQISVEAKDRKGISGTAGIEEVLVYLDGGPKAVLEREPYRVAIETCLLTPGQHSIRVIARDSDSLIAAETIMFKVESTGRGKE